MFVRALGAAVLLAAGVTVYAVTASGQVVAPDEGATPAPAPVRFALVGPKVAPSKAYFARRPVRITFAFAGSARADLQIEIVRGAKRRLKRRILVRAAVPGAPQLVRWDGVTDSGHAAPDGRYGVRVVGPGGRARRAGAFTLRGHMFPIRGPHADRGPIGFFGVPRNGGRTHEGFDVNAACGTPLVAARGGTVVRSTYDPVLYGNDVKIRGRLDNLEYRYSHLLHPALVREGDTVHTGQRIGVVGDTGNARSVGCHLHFELRRNGVLVDPKPYLHAWDGWS
ncbi:MAG: peptidoglycan LD-endopeptidase LytH [Solirubrobacteraceae bacterium]|nr:peptidoglycan LD-endopeptidase LytH [Solirubrobacteraceae bacterium]